MCRLRNYIHGTIVFHWICNIIILLCVIWGTTVYPKKYAHGFCFVVVTYWLIFPQLSGLLHWHCGNLTIAPVPAKQPLWIWINTSCQFIMNDCITTTKQSTTNPCAYFFGYTVLSWHRCIWLTTVLQTHGETNDCRVSTYSFIAHQAPAFIFTVYPKTYAHGFVVLCFVVVMQSFIMNSHEVFIHIHQGCFAGTGAIVRLPQCQWSKPDGYGKISQCITTTKHSKAKTVCIFLGIYCTCASCSKYQCITYWPSSMMCMSFSAADDAQQNCGHLFTFPTPLGATIQARTPASLQRYTGKNYPGRWVILSDCWFRQIVGNKNQKWIKHGWCLGGDTTYSRCIWRIIVSIYVEPCHLFFPKIFIMFLLLCLKVF